MCRWKQIFKLTILKRHIGFFVFSLPDMKFVKIPGFQDGQNYFQVVNVWVNEWGIYIFFYKFLQNKKLSGVIYDAV